MISAAPSVIPRFVISYQAESFLLFDLESSMLETNPAKAAFISGFLVECCSISSDKTKFVKKHFLEKPRLGGMIAIVETSVQLAAPRLLRLKSISISFINRFANFRSEFSILCCDG